MTSADNPPATTFLTWWLRRNLLFNIDPFDLVHDEVWSYTYDAENRLITMTSATLPTGFTHLALGFQYDYLGRRVAKTVYNSDTKLTTLSRHYVYDGWALIAETDTSTSGKLLRSYTWGLDLAGSLNATGGVGALLQITNFNSNGSTTNYFPTVDGNGNVAALVREDGTLAAAYEYSPAGEPLRKEVFDTAVGDNPFRFSSKFTDEETGLVYYGSRFYSPALGRFINRDSIAEAGGLNLYGFCGNDGVNRTDYLGNSWLSKIVSKFTRWASHHSIASSFVVGALNVGSPEWTVTFDASLNAAAHDVWHGAQRNPQIAAVVAAIATWYIGGWGASAVLALDSTEATVIAGAAAGAAGGFVGARASGADLSTSFRAGYQGAAWGAALAFAGNEILGAKFTPFSLKGAEQAFVTAEARYEVGRFAQNKLGISGWEFDAGLLAFSYIGYKAFGDPYNDVEKGNHGPISYIGGFSDRDPATGWFFKSGGAAHFWGEFLFDASDQLLQWQGLPDAGAVARAYHGWGFPSVGHSLGASRLVTLASLGIISGGQAVALPFGEVAPGGVQAFIGDGDLVPGFAGGLLFNPDATTGSVPFITGHAFDAYVKTFQQL